MNYFKRKLLAYRLRLADQFISRELERIKINHPATRRGVLTEYRYRWLRGAAREIMSPSDWREAWED